MKELIIREATAADLPALIAILVDDDLGRLREDNSLPLDPGYLAAFDAIAADPNQYLFAAEQADELIGTFQLSFLPGLSHRGSWRGQIEAVRIAGHARGRGLGARMMEWAIARCRERGCRIVQLTTNVERTRAHDFYRRLGFVGTHVGMKLTLSK